MDNKSPTFVYLVAKELDCEEFDGDWIGQESWSLKEFKEIPNLSSLLV